MKRIGIFGGTFNPIHIGHMAAAGVAFEKMRLDKVIFVPAANPPHKSSKGLAPAEERLKMVRMSIKANKSFEVSDFEIKRGGKSYSYETVCYFTELSPKARLFFIIGEDALPGLNKWHKIAELQKLVDFVAVNRPGVKKKASKINYHSIVMPGIDVSSSFVRQCVSKGKSIKYFVPEGIERFINKNKLFKPKN